MNARPAPSDFRTPMSRVRSSTVVYIVKKIISKPMATARPIMALINVCKPGMFVEVISDNKELTGRTV